MVNSPHFEYHRPKTTELKKKRIKNSGQWFPTKFKLIHDKIEPHKEWQTLIIIRHCCIWTACTLADWRIDKQHSLWRAWTMNRCITCHHNPATHANSQSETQNLTNLNALRSASTVSSCFVFCFFQQTFKTGLHKPRFSSYETRKLGSSKIFNCKT